MRRNHSGLLITLVIALMLLYAVSSLIQNLETVISAEESREKLQKELAAVLQENARLEYKLAHSDDPETIASAAREVLGLVLPEEKVFYFPAD